MKKLKVKPVKLELGDEDDGTIPEHLKDDTGESEVKHIIESNGKRKSGRTRTSRKSKNSRK